MPARGFHQHRTVFSGSNVLNALATALSEIKDADDLTDADMGALLGKSADQARAYRRGALTTLIEAASGLSKALEDGVITAEEVRDNRPQLEAARDAIDAQLRKLRPAA